MWTAQVREDQRVQARLGCTRVPACALLHRAAANQLLPATAQPLAHAHPAALLLPACLPAGQHVLERTSVLIHADGAVEARFTGGRCSHAPRLALRACSL